MSACECPPCPGRGYDGHGMNHCAECCFGSRVIADIGCPIHGEATEVVVHECPPEGSGVMPCCGRTPFEVPQSDRMTSTQTVTCDEGETP